MEQGGSQSSTVHLPGGGRHGEGGNERKYSGGDEDKEGGDRRSTAAQEEEKRNSSKLSDFHCLTQPALAQFVTSSQEASSQAESRCTFV